MSVEYIPSEILREIVSFGRYPYARGVSRTLREVEEAANQQRLENMRQDYIERRRQRASWERDPLAKYLHEQQLIGMDDGWLLRQAILFQNIGDILFLLEQGITLPDLPVDFLLNVRDITPFLPYLKRFQIVNLLTKAAREGDKEKLDILLEYSNYRNLDYLAIESISENGNVDIASYLVSKGATDYDAIAEAVTGLFRGDNYQDAIHNANGSEEIYMENLRIGAERIETSLSDYVDFIYRMIELGAGDYNQILNLNDEERSESFLILLLHRNILPLYILHDYLNSLLVDRRISIDEHRMVIRAHNLK